MKKIPIFLLATLALLPAGCSDSPIIDHQVNTDASFPGNLSFDRKGLKVISTFIDRKQGLVSTLYGNDIALNAAKSGTQESARGLVMVMATWSQQPNPYWYGNNIPGRLRTVEMVTSNSQTGKHMYSTCDQKSWQGNSVIPNSEERIRYILGLKPSVMP
ncbi:hypothetical protein SAMN05428949_1216 [Chitinophaga sp. YR627]|uniref:cytochrome P460 family protein n=1 Tax=Chitinophaga sp. YR627 TaxID=1881041 RepID=UPI0008F3EB93|nr:cytochrome P460 family protein [Chitinophaga sp. YR627]SFM89810.1 hypothetical protein SAMN05428949_1216 [Chitinophaga sp. YR627]